MAGQSSFAVGSLDLNSGRIGDFKNKIVEASTFKVCFRDNLSRTLTREASTLARARLGSCEDFSVLKISKRSTRCKWERRVWSWPSHSEATTVNSFPDDSRACFKKTQLLLNTSKECFLLAGL